MINSTYNSLNKTILINDVNSPSTSEVNYTNINFPHHKEIDRVIDLKLKKFTNINKQLNELKNLILKYKPVNIIFSYLGDIVASMGIIVYLAFTIAFLSIQPHINPIIILIFCTTPIPATVLALPFAGVFCLIDYIFKEHVINKIDNIEKGNGCEDALTRIKNLLSIPFRNCGSVSTGERSDIFKTELNNIDNTIKQKDLKIYLLQEYKKNKRDFHYFLKNKLNVDTTDIEQIFTTISNNTDLIAEWLKRHKEIDEATGCTMPKDLIHLISDYC